MERTRPEVDQDRTFFLVVASCAFLYIVLRAIQVPLIHDEANSFWWYARTGEFIPYHCHENTGNHVLGSFFGWIGQSLFGPGPWALRLGSVLAFPLYAWSCRGLVMAIESVLVRRTVLLALLWCPFVLDYFALFRGYGIGLACSTSALLHTLRMGQRPRIRIAVFVALGMAGATLANLSYVTLWVVLAGLVSLIAVRQRRDDVGPWWGWALLGLFQSAGICAAVRLVLHYMELGQLDFGHREGFVAGTLAELAGHLSGADGPLLAPMVVVLVMAALVVGVLAARRYQRWYGPLILLGAIWGAEVVGRWSLFRSMDVMPPPARAALYMVPLTVLVFGHGLDRAAVRWPLARWGVLILLVLPVRAVERAGFTSVMGSEEQAVPPHFAAHAARLQAHLGRPVMVGFQGALFPAWAYQLFRTGAHVNDAQPENEFPDQDLRLLPAGAPEELRTGFHVVDEVPEDRLQLLERDVPLDLVPVLDTVLAAQSDRAEHVRIYSTDGRFADTALWVRLEGRLSTSSRVMDVQFITAEHAGPRSVAYEESMLWHERRQWRGEAFDVMRLLPARPEATERIAYLWNITGTNMELSELHLRVYRKAP